MKYALLEGSSSELTVKVNEHLANGWQLHGSPYILNNNHYQAMVNGAPQLQAATATLEAATPEINIYLPENFKFTETKKAEPKTGK